MSAVGAEAGGSQIKTTQRVKASLGNQYSKTLSQNNFLEDLLFKIMCMSLYLCIMCTRVQVPTEGRSI